jgi:hypothetical protein
VEQDNDRKHRRPTPEKAAVWILGFVLLAVVAFAVVLILL